MILSLTVLRRLDCVLPGAKVQDILKVVANFRDGDTRAVAKDDHTEDIIVSRIFPTTHSGFRRITIERPLRLNFQATPERIADSRSRRASRRWPEFEGCEAHGSSAALLQGVARRYSCRPSLAR